MRLHTPILLLGALTTCGDDKKSTDEEVGIPCDANFTIVRPDGTTGELDECKHHGVNMVFAKSDDAIVPEPHTISFIFRSTKDTSVDCFVRWDIEGVCLGRPWHDLGSASSSLTWNTNDCDVPSEAQGEFEADYGSSNFTTLTIAPVSGLEEGDPMTVDIVAEVDAETEDGTTLTGSIVVSRDIDISYIPLGSCTGSDGDNDQDGSVGEQYGGDDCDDNNGAIGPHAIEVCDGVDNNCDGQIDEDQMGTFYVDADGDGHGDLNQPIEACEAPEGTSIYSGDCDDLDASINPDASELCDGVDNDCDGGTDEGALIAAYPDVDLDTYGDDDSMALMCPSDVPEDWTTDGGDCDDTDENINPGVEELCDGIDNNCDTVIDEECD